MNIKDYIHYYLEQKAIFDNNVWTISRVGTVIRLTRGTTRRVEVHPEEIKLLLRRIESLTNDEVYHYFNSISSEKYIRDQLHVIKRNMIDLIGMTPARFHYLLSLGIDLFGLIDAGLAVDAATLNNKNQQG